MTAESASTMSSALLRSSRSILADILLMYQWAGNFIWVIIINECVRNNRLIIYAVISSSYTLYDEGETRTPPAGPSHSLKDVRGLPTAVSGKLLSDERMERKHSLMDNMIARHQVSSWHTQENNYMRKFFPKRSARLEWCDVNQMADERDLLLTFERRVTGVAICLHRRDWRLRDDLRVTKSN